MAGQGKDVRRYIVEADPADKRSLLGVMRLLRRAKNAHALVIKIEVEAPADGGIYIWARWYPLKIEEIEDSRSH